MEFFSKLYLVDKIKNIIVARYLYVFVARIKQLIKSDVISHWNLV